MNAIGLCGRTAAAAIVDAALVIDARRINVLSLRLALPLRLVLPLKPVLPLRLALPLKPVSFLRPRLISSTMDSGKAVPSGICTMPIAFSRQRSETLLTRDFSGGELPADTDGRERWNRPGFSPKSRSRKARVFEPPSVLAIDPDRDRTPWLPLIDDGVGDSR